MKHWSLWLTVLLLGSLPLTAMALDYGPNQSLRASGSSGTPQLPGSQVNATSAEEMPAAATASADDAASLVSPASQARPMTQPGAITQPGVTLPTRTSPTDHGRLASDKTRRHSAPPASSARRGETPKPPSWQSLLPGSIQ